MDELTSALADLEEPRVLELVERRLAASEDAVTVLNACQQGMRVVGERFEAGDYYVSDLMMAGAIFKRVSERLERVMGGVRATTRGAVVIGTVEGDIHDIGKDLVVMALRSAGYAVTDLGVDVPPQRFVDAVRETKAPVLGLSGLLTIAFEPMRETVIALEEAGLRPSVKVMLGGGPVTEDVRVFAGADAVGADPPAAVRLTDQWMEALQ